MFEGPPAQIPTDAPFAKDEDGGVRPNQFVLIFHRKKENRIIISTDLDLKTFMYQYGVKEK
jgi:hypothetical protein